ncbi:MULTISPECIES: SMI1/KNR4 family protein [unclassified Streptomyces]|uniref:SMI1/KNR4 family protein n=1 Tax=unclassified Streptomyces TaxID=2593676 RepID=UPI002DD84359|nr:SMI1/KNR4 family protein [Streptomyces sp. NBC_01750]WSB05122.1 SMI1/KNR4 family protein [Streptomyces sp. NBC_01794]WSD30546.1 SMI1/KNR4 family protein [Streptomyces sp. NBC_01750]
MTWVQRIVEAVGWQPAGLDIAWGDVETRLGTDLPSDFKELCEAFGEGEFSGYLEVYSSSGGSSLKVVNWLEGVLQTLEQYPEARDTFSPYGTYTPGGQGLLSWGGSANASDFCWFVNGGPPDKWPVVAREEIGAWQEFSMPMSEFVFRVLTDVEFEEFTVAHLIERPFYRSGA